MVYFKEVLPNPAGRDTEGEWITIINIGDDNASLSGWRVSDKSGKQFSFNALRAKSRELEPGGEITLTYSATRISLNNDGDTLQLTDANGNAIDTLTYSGPVADDEVVFGELFSPSVRENEASGITSLAQAGGAFSGTEIIITPLIIALGLALAFGVGVGAVARRKEEE